ncbi:MAG: DUF4388 domain-containing protein [Aggregatilineales bacterium]
MPLQGNIRDFSTAQLLNLMNLSRRTGTLTIHEAIPTDQEDAMKNQKFEAGEEKARVAFSKGKLIYAALTDQSGGLVYVLNKAGKLTNDQARLLRERAGNTNDKALAMRLISAKYVSQGDIVKCIKDNMVDVLRNMMTWKNGPFKFEDDVLPDSGHILVPVDLEPVIVDLARVVRDLEEINRVVDDLDAALRFPQNPREKFKGIHLGVEEWKVVSYVNPKNSIRQIMKQLNMSEVEIKKVIYGLHQAGLIHIVKKTAKDNPPANTGSKRRSKRRAGSGADKKTINKLIDKLRSMND